MKKQISKKITIIALIIMLLSPHFAYAISINNSDEPNTEAKIEINKENWSTVIENKEVEIAVTLSSSENKHDLYKNPSIRLEFPADVTEINVNSVNKLYGDEFELEKAYREKVDGKQYIYIKLIGEQTEFKEASIEGTRLVINANISLNKIATSKTDNIILTVTNEAGSNVTKEQPISIVSPKELITTQNIEELGIETIGEEDETSATVKIGAEEKSINVKSQIINNNNANIKDVSILGTFGTNNEENNMGVNLSSKLSVEGIDLSKVSVYYTENSEANKDLEDESNGWSESITDNSRVSKYLVKVTDMAQTESLMTSYSLAVPANLEYDQESSQGYSVTYTNESTGENGTVDATTINLETGEGPVVEANLIAIVGNRVLNENDKVKQGEVIKYQIEVKNTGTEDATNITVKGDVPEGTVAVEAILDYQYEDGEYYQEVEKENYEFQIDELKVGETFYIYYEVRVGKATIEGTQITNKLSYTYDGIEKLSDALSNIIEEGNIRVSIKTTTDNEIINEGEIVGYQAIIENITNEEQKDITINWNIPEVYKINSHYILNKSDTEEIENYTESYINIKSIPANEKIIIDINLVVDKKEGIEKNSIIATAIQGEKSYYSNELLQAINSLTNVQVMMEATNAENYVKPGDIITYTITAVNNNTQATQISICDQIPSDLTVTNVLLNGEEQNLNEEVNQISLHEIKLEVGEQVVVQIQAVVNTREGVEKSEISNQATILVNYKEIVSNAVSHIIEYKQKVNPDNPDNPDNPNPPIDPENPDNPDNPDTPNTYSIRGKVWLDENTDGELQETEKIITGTKVCLLNVTTGELAKDSSNTEIVSTTGEDGVYVLNNIPEGKYIVIFDYDSSKYTLTTYEKIGADESKTSNVISKKLEINKIEKNYAVTDSIEIVDKSIGNINMGLVKSKEFDFKLDKTISKVIVQNSEGTNTYSYENASLAKVELHSKTINNSNVIVEYQIKVTNQGELDGYVKKIVDYLPDGFKFSSELNKDWYQSGAKLFNNTLANEKIMPGESKTVKLSLIMTMTSETTGTYRNTAEIAEDYNDAGIIDINSVPNNMKEKENDISSAELIITVSTGVIAIYTMIIFVSIIIIATGIYFIKTKILDIKN